MTEKPFSNAEVMNLIALSQESTNLAIKMKICENTEAMELTELAEQTLFI